MKIEVNKEQLELLKYAILWYECNDENEERICEELERNSTMHRNRTYLDHLQTWEDFSNGSQF